MALSSNPRKIANAPIGSFLVAGFDNPLGYIQGVCFVDENGTPLDLAALIDASSPQTATQINSTVSTAKTIAAANASRRGGYIQAAWGNTDNIYLSFNSPATSSDIPIAPGGVFNMTLNYGGPPVINAIYGIAGSGTQAYCVVEA